MRYDNFEKKHIKKKLTKPTYRTKLVSSLASFFFLIALGLGAYLPAGLDGKLGTEDDKTFTISRALANANKPSFIALIAVSYFFLIYLIIIRGPSSLFLRRFLLITVAFSLVVSLLWVTTKTNENLHYTFAGIIFTFILIYNVTTFYLFYKTKYSDRNLMLFLIFFNFLTYFTLIAFAILKGSKLDPDVFASAEIFFAILFVSNVLFTGFY